MIAGICCGAGGVSGRIATCSLDRTVRLWDLPANAQLAAVVLPVAVNALAMDAAESYVYAAGADGRVFQIDLVAHARGGSGSAGSGGSANESATGLPAWVRPMMGHSKAVTSLALSFDGATLTSSSLDGMARFFHACVFFMLAPQSHGI